MFHNTTQYWQSLELLKLYAEHPKYRGELLPSQLAGCPIGRDEIPTARVCRLLHRAFVRWKCKPQWLTEKQTGHLLHDAPAAEAGRLSRLPVAVRKGMAVARVLDIVTRPDVAAAAGTLQIDPDEFVVGCIPPYSVGQGKELVGYLTEEEELQFGLEYLNDRSPFGHIVPNHGRILKDGILGTLEYVATRRRRLKGSRANNQKQQSFYESVKLALEGVLLFAERYARSAHDLAERLRLKADPRAEEVLQVARRLEHTPANPPRTFLEAVQCVYLMHCALHTSGEIVPLGRLDQLLWPFLQADSLKTAQAQEIIDCLWIKFGERAIHRRQHLEDRFTFADGALLGNKGASNFDQGGLVNQWMQQVTIGGVIADNVRRQRDASNPVTFLCLNAARRLPLNSPTLDLRLHRQSPRKLLEAAADTLLSGGAHPVLLNDDRIIPALHKKSGGRVELASARNYACDGCYETLFAGETEFSFYYIPALDLLEKALNRGAGFAMAGPAHLRGWKDSLRTPDASDFSSFEVFWGCFGRHLEFSCHRFFHNVLKYYGEKEHVAPSPLLSSLIAGCLESGRDLTGGGARYHLFSPLMTGIATCADSLYVIDQLVFRAGALSMAELISCLRTNWGQSEALGRHVSPVRIAEIRELCRSQPKFGHGNTAVDKHAYSIIQRFYKTLERVKNHPLHQPAFATLRKRYGADFELLLAPGVGTFEQYVYGGGFVGATPNGRRARDPIESDLSPAPLYRDVPPHDGAAAGTRHARTVAIFDGLASYAAPTINLLSDGAPADINIAEDFPRSALVKLIRRFSQGECGNILTVTVGSPETFAKAMQETDDEFELVRVRMGGWSEFFIALFPEHREQHIRRPLFTP